jgi:hypothetical protein
MQFFFIFVYYKMLSNSNKGLVHLIVVFDSCDTGIYGNMILEKKISDFVNVSVSFNEVLYYCLNKYPNFKYVVYKGQKLFNPKMFI